MKKGFTLAEILIVLIVIGFVSLLTVPSLIEMYKFRVLTARFNRIYSELTTMTTEIIEKDNLRLLPNEPSGFYASAYTLFTTNDHTWAANVTENRRNLLREKHLAHCQENYGFGNCFADRYTNVNGDITKDWQTTTFTNAFTLAYNVTAKTSWGASFTLVTPVDYTTLRIPLSFKRQRKVLNDRGEYETETRELDQGQIPASLFVVDVNGQAGPNVVGYDLFSFLINEDGSLSDVPGFDSDNCSVVWAGNSTPRWSQIISSTFGCVNRVIENGGKIVKFER